MRGGRAALALVPLALVAAASPPPEQGATADDAVVRSVAQAQALLLSDPARAGQLADTASVDAGRIPDPAQRASAHAQADWLRAEARLSLNRPTEAEAIADRALKSLDRSQAARPLTADLLRTRGFAEVMLGRVEAALTDFQRAFQLFTQTGNTRRQALTLQDIGAIYSDAGDYAHMLRYYRQSAELAGTDASVQLAAHYNVALALGKMQRYADAELEFTRALASAHMVRNVSYELRVLTELSEVQIRSGKLAAAERSANEAWDLSRTDPGAAGWKPLVLGVMARVALARGDLGQAEADLRLALKGVDLTRTDLSYRDLHELAVRVFRARGDDALALANFEAMKRLDDQAQTIASNTNAALMSARFDFQNQDLRIARLQASQLQQAVQLEHARTHLHRIVFIVSAVLGGALFVFMGIALAVTRRSRNQIRTVNGELSHTNAALERALKVKTEFLATTSHEIRTPLNGILGMTQVLLANRGLDEPVRDRIEVVHSAGQTMRALVDDILDVAKLESGRVEIEAAPISLLALFTEASRLWSAEAGRKGLTFKADIGEAPERIVADEQRLRQILFNLLSNAIKFTHTGRVAMVATVLNEPKGEMLEIRVEDTGIGIAPELHEAIFESFRQADSGTTRRFGGTGLGLTICRRLAAAMGGTVSVASEADQGATFTLRVPLARIEDESASEGRCGDQPATSLDCSRLLIVERNPLNRGILTALLTPACREVVSADEAEAASALATSGGVDLVLADTTTLGDGAEAIAAAIASFGGVPVVLLMPKAADALDRATVGADMIVTKPVAGADLIARLCGLFASKAHGATDPADPGMLRSAAR